MAIENLTEHEAEQLKAKRAERAGKVPWIANLFKQEHPDVYDHIREEAKRDAAFASTAAPTAPAVTQQPATPAAPAQTPAAAAPPNPLDEINRGLSARWSGRGAASAAATVAAPPAAAMNTAEQSAGDVSGYHFAAELGLSWSAFNAWCRQGFVPAAKTTAASGNKYWDRATVDATKARYGR